MLLARLNDKMVGQFRYTHTHNHTRVRPSGDSGPPGGSVWPAVLYFVRYTKRCDINVILVCPLFCTRNKNVCGTVPVCALTLSALPEVLFSVGMFVEI